VQVVETGSSAQRGGRTLDSAAPESASTTIYLASGTQLRSATGIESHRDDSVTRRNIESGRRAPVGGLALTPPSRSPERSMFNAVSKVDRGCSPFRFSDLSALGMRTQTDIPADTCRSWRTISPSRPRCSFATSNAIGSDLRTHKYRRVILDNIDTRSTDLRLSPNHTRNFRSAVDYRRDARELRRHLQVLESNRTLEKFMRVLRKEKEAEATAALFSTPSTANCRQRSRTISFAVDGEYRPVTSSAITSSRDGTGNPCRSENKPAKSIIRCNSPIARQSANAFHLRLDEQRHQLGKTEGSSRRDLEDWTKCLEDRPRLTSTPRPAS